MHRVRSRSSRNRQADSKVLTSVDSCSGLDDVVCDVGPLETATRCPNRIEGPDAKCLLGLRVDRRSLQPDDEARRVGLDDDRHVVRIDIGGDEQPVRCGPRSRCARGSNAPSAGHRHHAASTSSPARATHGVKGSRSAGPSSTTGTPARSAHVTGSLPDHGLRPHERREPATPRRCHRPTGRIGGSRRCRGSGPGEGLGRARREGQADPSNGGRGDRPLPVEPRRPLPRPDGPR